MTDGNELISKLVKLKDIRSPKDIPTIAYAVYPGMHCPLFGSVMALKGISDAYMLIVGTDECTYYSKDFSIRSGSFGGLGGRCVSAVLDSRDVTFGCKNMLDEAVQELVEEYSPRAVFIVTTCVVEVTGDDTDSMAMLYSEKYGIPFLSIHTEHFKCENHMPGIERTMTACLGLMSEEVCDGSYNVLGQRMGVFDTTELAGILRDCDLKCTMQLPNRCTVEDIKNASRAKVNIVVEPTGIPLAKKMQEKFGIDYVEFFRYTEPGDIFKSYEKLFGILEMPLPQKVISLYENALKVKEEAKKSLAGVSYIYGNTVMDGLELNAFMVSLGMVPRIIQTLSIEGEKEKTYVSDILKSSDPYVLRPANIAPLQYVYDILKPDLYLGHESAVNLAKKGVALVRSDSAAMKLGFELTSFMVKALCEAAERSHSLREEMQ